MTAEIEKIKRRLAYLQDQVLTRSSFNRLKLEQTVLEQTILIWRDLKVIEIELEKKEVN